MNYTIVNMFCVVFWFILCLCVMGPIYNIYHSYKEKRDYERESEKLGRWQDNIVRDDLLTDSERIFLQSQERHQGSTIVIDDPFSAEDWIESQIQSKINSEKEKMKDKFKVGDWVMHECYGIGFVYSSAEKLRVSFPWFRASDPYNTWCYKDLDELYTPHFKRIYPKFDNLEDQFMSCPDGCYIKPEYSPTDVPGSWEWLGENQLIVDVDNKPKTTISHKTNLYSFNEEVRCKGEKAYFHGWHIDPKSGILFYKVRFLGQDTLSTVLTRNVHKLDQEGSTKKENSKEPFEAKFDKCSIAEHEETPEGCEWEKVDRKFEPWEIIMGEEIRSMPILDENGWVCYQRLVKKKEVCDEPFTIFDTPVPDIQCRSFAKENLKLKFKAGDKVYLSDDKDKTLYHVIEIVGHSAFDPVYNIIEINHKSIRLNATINVYESELRLFEEEKPEPKFRVGDRVVFEDNLGVREISNITAFHFDRMGKSYYYSQSSGDTKVYWTESHIFKLNDPEILRYGDTVKVIRLFEEEDCGVTISLVCEDERLKISTVGLDHLDVTLNRSGCMFRFSIPIEYVELVLD